MSNHKSDRRFLSVMLVPDDGGMSRTFRLAHGRIRLFVGLGLAGVVLLLGMIASWTYLATQASTARRLQAEVTVLREDQRRLQAVAEQLAALEARYEQIQLLFGSDSSGTPSELWLPPLNGPVRSTPPRAESERGLPTSWPLTQRGFVTQGLLAGESGEHPGVDIAVPAGSYVRAAGAGTAVDVGEDEVYGRFLVIEHAGGYQTLYAHASQTLVRPGQEVLRNEVIALSGSTGRSTAPHLHFEILLDGEAVDPMTMVRPPS